MNSLHTLVLEDICLDIVLRGSLFAFLYPNVFIFLLGYGCHQMLLLLLCGKKTNIKVLWEDCKHHSVSACLW